MRERFDSEYIHSELERIGDHLETSLTVYLIGGGSMAFRDLKETTKDIDLVVADGDALQQLQVALLDCGYDVVKANSASYCEIICSRYLSCRHTVIASQVTNSRTRL